uniref:Uncharacterized protein n=1 Tax=Schlesneria paludicola TaxID=360056 RepID=A0A7C4QTB7_9PLAN
MWSSGVELGLCLLAGWRWQKLQSCVQGTTLVDAWRWGGVVLVAAALTAGVRLTTGRAFPAGDCLLAVCGLTPLMAVLGARRPTCRVWTAFVVLPLLLVLSWPILTVVSARGPWGKISLETPTVFGFGFVAVMACGNYVGTRLMFSAVAWGSAVMGLWLCHADLAPAGWPTASTMRLVLGTVGLWALWDVQRAWQGRHPAADRFNRLWFDVLDRFGVVWARRLQERLNALGRQQGWSGRLELDGWHWTTAPDPQEQARVEQAFRWLLRRFVDPPWIDARLETASPSAAVSFAIDS